MGGKEFLFVLWQQKNESFCCELFALIWWKSLLPSKGVAYFKGLKFLLDFPEVSSSGFIRTLWRCPDLLQSSAEIGPENIP